MSSKNKRRAAVVSTAAPESRMLTIAQAAEYLNSTKWFVRNLAWDRRVPYAKFGNRFVFDRADLDQFIENEKVR